MVLYAMALACGWHVLVVSAVITDRLTLKLTPHYAHISERKWESERGGAGMWVLEDRNGPTESLRSYQQSTTAFTKR